jgi:hypothetical protein
MWDVLFGLAFLAMWMLLQVWLLPRLNIPT